MTFPMGTLVLDSEGLSAWISEDRKISAWIDSAQRREVDLAISANTIIEVTYAGTNMARLNWLLSRINVVPVTQESAKAAGLLKEAGLHGHKYALDATVAEVALRQSGPVAILTSDIDDMSKLCGNKVRLLPI
jgi:predicted nucleic acid-binding protein